jgi:hypothetical protein
VGIVATIGANLAHGMGHGPIGALVSAWPAVALVGSYELLMALVRAEQRTIAVADSATAESNDAPLTGPDVPLQATEVPSLEQMVRTRYEAGDSQRAISRDLKIDRRKVKRIIEQAA